MKFDQNTGNKKGTTLEYASFDSCDKHDENYFKNWKAKTPVCLLKLKESISTPARVNFLALMIVR